MEGGGGSGERKKGTGKLTLTRFFSHKKKTDIQNSAQHLAELLRRRLGPRARDEASPGLDDRDPEGGGSGRSFLFGFRVSCFCLEKRDREQTEKKSHSLFSSLSPPPRPRFFFPTKPKLCTQLLNQYDCVTTPAEFAAAFKANTPRCVSDDLVGKLSSGNSVEQATNRSVRPVRVLLSRARARPLLRYLSLSLPVFFYGSRERKERGVHLVKCGDRKQKKKTDPLFFSLSNNLKKKQSATDLRAANFWAGSDALAKYLRIGYPKNIGISIPEIAPNSYNTQSYESANFAGLKEYR